MRIFTTCYADAAQPWQLGFQDAGSPSFTGIIELHNIIFFYLIIISIGVFWILGSLIYFYSNKNNTIAHKYLTHGTLIELIWTITPALILLLIAWRKTEWWTVLNAVWVS
jgi:cytochrome c oxidase subunit 2